MLHPARLFFILFRFNALQAPNQIADEIGAAGSEHAGEQRADPWEGEFHAQGGF